MKKRNEFSEEYLSTIAEYLHCPSCGNPHIGKGEGTIQVNGDRLTRKCKCGFNETKKVIE